MSKSDTKIAIIGLGYVGLPLAVEFAKKYQVIGFDINQNRIEELEKNNDSTLEIKDEAISSVRDNLNFTSNINDTKDCNIYIICMPTPIDGFNKPNLEPLINSSKTVGTVIKKNDIIIYESTVYPGVTEDVCVKELEKSSGLKFNQDFFCGYSPERINPGDKVNTLTKIKKVTSGSIPLIAEYVDQLYKGILEAAGTKWNFLKFTPGLVGGHCISVDPYYLTHKAKELGYDPQVILSGRKINDYMPSFVAQKMVKLMGQKGIPLNQSRCLILGITFKENCPDIRNSKIPQVVRELEEYGITVYTHDSHADSNEVKRNFNIELI